MQVDQGASSNCIRSPPGELVSPAAGRLASDHLVSIGPVEVVEADGLLIAIEVKVAQW
jgi:hypothetical protein